jgi:hypothetical protein
MHRLIRGAQVCALALLLVLGAGSVACKKSSSGTSNKVFNASGGDANATDGFGGDAGEINLYISYGGAGAIEVSSSGSVDASFTATALFAPDLGTNGLVVTNDLSIPVVTTAPALNIPYMIEDDENLYVSDGDMEIGDETPVTGLQVQTGVTVTLGLNFDDAPPMGVESGGLVFSDDMVNDGTITVVDVDTEQRGSLFFYVGGDYIGSGGIQTFGTIPGQYGGDIFVAALGNGYNSGRWLSYGAAQTDGEGGNGGDIEFATGDDSQGGLIENTGDMTSNGGAASGAIGDGGDAGDIQVVPYLSLWNSGDLDAIGGDGIDAGGDGGDIRVAGSYRGELRNTGDLTSDGGDAAAGNAGDAGDIDLEARGDDLRSSGVMLARGGDSANESDDGGAGGDITYYVTSSDDDYEASELDVPAGDLWVSGGAIATGGDATATDGGAGDGGDIDLYVENDISEGLQEIHALGIKGLYALGGDADLAGGDGELISFDLASVNGTITGSVNVEPPMNTSGGDADPNTMGSTGGDAGDIEIFAAHIVYGSATADGGTGATPGSDGMITPEAMAP